MQLFELQRRMASALFDPLPARTDDALYSLIVGSGELPAIRRLRIYREGYWSRVLEALKEDFVGLQAILGKTRYDSLLRAYLGDHPSRSFTLRDLGQSLETWLERNLHFVNPDAEICLAMVRLEWAAIEAFDTAETEPLSVAELATAGAHSRFALQPHIRLLSLDYPADDIHLAAKDGHDRALQKALRKARAYKGPQIDMVIFRFENRVFFRQLVREEALILRSIASGATLESAIAQGFRDSSYAPQEQAKMLTESFGLWAQQGWLTPSRDVSL